MCFQHVKNPEYDGYKRALASMIHNIFDKKLRDINTSAGADKISGGAVKSKIMLNQHWLNELHKSIHKRFKKRKVYLSFEGSIWGADWAEMQLISKYNKGIRFVLCFSDFYNK